MPRRLLIVALLGLLGFVGGQPIRLAADTLPVVRLGVGPDSITMTPFYLAQRLGLFRREGVDVQFVTINSAALMVAPLGTGQLDVGAGAVSAGLYNAVSRGIDVRIVADLGSDPPGYGFQTLVVRNSLLASGGFKTLADLKGKTIAITAKGISTTAMVTTALRKAGLGIDDVKLTYLTVADQIAALRSGTIDASFMPEPGPTIAEHLGVATKILRDDAYYPNQELVVMLYGQSLLRERRDVGLRFMRAYLRAVRLYNDNTTGGKLGGPHAGEIVDIFSEVTHQDRTVLNHITPDGDDPDGRLNLASMRSDYDFFKQEGLIEGTGTGAAAAVDAVVDTSFAAAAVKELGPYRRR